MRDEYRDNWARYTAGDKAPHSPVTGTGSPPGYLEGPEGERRLGRLSAALGEMRRNRFRSPASTWPHWLWWGANVLLAVGVLAIALLLWLFVRWCVQ